MTPETGAGQRLLGGLPWTSERERDSWARMILAVELEAIRGSLARVEALITDRGGRCRRVGDVCGTHGEMWFIDGCEDEPTLPPDAVIDAIGGER